MRVNGTPYRTVWMDGELVKLIDQRRLPFAFAIVSLETPEAIAKAIREMTVRGAGAIGVTAGFGMALAALRARDASFDEDLSRAASVLRAARPTARNPFYAIERVLEGVREASSVKAKRQRAVAIAEAIADEDAAAGEAIGRIGQQIVPSPASILTHCNAGWLAFADWGTALAPIYRAHRDGKPVHVYATETRPRAQGARLTAWELANEGVSHHLIADTAVGHLMRQGRVNLVLVGADRVAANGDIANKIGTYQLAVLAKTHQIPFYVAVPTTTMDLSCPEGAAIPIEERAEEELLWATGMTSDGQETRVRIAADTPACNWAFDVTPAAYVTGLLTERGLIAATPEAIAALLRTPQWAS